MQDKLPGLFNFFSTSDRSEHVGGQYYSDAAVRLARRGTRRDNRTA